MKKLTLCFLACCFSTFLFAQDAETTTTEEEFELTEEMIAEYQAAMDSIEQSFTYDRGKIILSKNGTDYATLIVPDGYKYLDAEQTEYVLTELWGNPSSGLGMGMLFPEDMSPVSQDLTFGVEIDYADEGYIEDDEAANLDYDDLLSEMQSDAAEINQARIEQGYEPVELVGWAAPPFYDAASKKLHWAKELKFGEDEVNTLNYNIRILGRQGYINLNAIGDIDVLPVFEQDVDAILASVDFVEGQTYADFNPDVDRVAAYGIGGLIAGKVLAKAGFFALLAKFWKLILLGIAGAFMAIKRMLFGGSDNVA